jgi:competence protein ComEA
VRLPARRNDDADVIRARLRALLAEGARSGWVPDDPVDGSGVEDDEDASGDGPLRDGRLDSGGGVAGVGRHRALGPSVRVDPGRPGAHALWAAAAAAVVLLLLWTWLQRPAAEPVPVGSEQPIEETDVSEPSRTAVASPTVGEVAETSTTVVVSVVGLVAEPGLVTLASGSRVADAVEAAGGLLPDAEPASVNLAAVLADGQQVAVGVPPAAGAAPPGAPASSAGSGAVDLNTADVAALDGLPGIGPVLAQRIVDHRAQHGPFRQMADLLDVAGIGPAIVDGLADAATL